MYLGNSLYKPDWGSLDHCFDDPHRAKFENLRSLREYALEAEGPFRCSRGDTKRA
jgi:hypothetical protein